MPARLLLVFAALLAAPTAFAGPSDLTLVVRDEWLQRGIQGAYDQPFTSITGVPVRHQSWDGSLEALRSHAAAIQTAATTKPAANASVAPAEARDRNSATHDATTTAAPAQGTAARGTSAQGTSAQGTPAQGEAAQKGAVQKGAAPGTLNQGETIESRSHTATPAQESSSPGSSGQGSSGQGSSGQGGAPISGKPAQGSSPQAASIPTQGTPDPGAPALDNKATQSRADEGTWDIVLVGADELAIGCSEGLFERLDWSAIGGKDHYQPMAVSECGVGAIVANTVLSWDKEKLPVTPSWSDFWDVAKYPGKRGLRKGVRGNLEIALMADGVAPGDVYKTLASNEGVDRAFRKLDQLKPYIVWWANDAEAAKIIASGDVLMTSAPSGPIARTAALQHRNFGLQFNDSLYEVQSWAVMKGSPLSRVAQQYLYLAGMPAVELRLLRQSGDAALAKGLTESLSPEMAAASASNIANLSSALRLDINFWHENLPKLHQRFATWLDH